MSARHPPLSFEALLREHRGLVVKIAAAYAHDADDRHDLVQEISLQLWRALPGYDAARARLSTWLYRIALNVAISHRRRDGGRLAGRTVPLDSHHLDTIAGDASSGVPDERLVTLHGFIAELDPMHRALVLLYLDDRSYAEIADVLGISLTNVATRLGRIKQALRSRAAAHHTTGA